jgi:hypothetical protein
MHPLIAIRGERCGKRDPDVSGQIEPGTVYLAQWRRVTKYYAGGGTRWGQASAGGKTGLSANARATNDAAFPWAWRHAKEPFI